MRIFNKRFHIYARSLGRTVEDVAKDRPFLFQVWLMEQLSAWRNQMGRDQYAHMSEQDHEDFEAWLEDRVETVGEAV